MNNIQDLFFSNFAVTATAAAAGVNLTFVVVLSHYGRGLALACRIVAAVTCPGLVVLFTN
jgi:hypothetical protein